MDSVTAVVPCSTSNLGSGFDTLGLALAWHSRVVLRRASGGRVTLAGPAQADGGMCAAVAEAFFRLTGQPPFGVEIFISTEVPVARGLGFSATLRAGIAAGLNELSGAQLTRHDLVHLVTQLEGHPDNASPSILGGFTVSGPVAGATRCLRFPVEPALKAVTLVPRFHVRTDAARALLPERLASNDAAHALNRAALITAAFAARDYDALRGLFDDRFHQPYRLKLVPQLDRVIAAGVEAAALGGFLSGSGSAIICLTLRDPDRVAAAMHAQLADSEVVVLDPENNGLRVEPA